MESMQIDSTVFVGFFRKNKQAQDYLLNLQEDVVLSRVVLMEIVAGLKSKEKIKKMKEQLEELHAILVEVDEEISELAGELFEKYNGTEGIGLMDAFIAASALVDGGKLVTHNTKHFRFIKELELVVPY